MKVITSDTDISNMFEPKSFKIFLAGGMGSDWRKDLIDMLTGEDILVLDPTVKDWDKTVGEASVDNPKFVAQTDWEQLGLIMADVEVFCFDDKSLAPISLLEMGLYKTPNSIILLKDGYEKAEYINYISRRFGIPIVKTLKELSQLINIKHATRLQA